MKTFHCLLLKKEYSYCCVYPVWGFLEIELRIPQPRNRGKNPPEKERLGVEALAALLREKHAHVLSSDHAESIILSRIGRALSQSELHQLRRALVVASEKMNAGTVLRDGKPLPKRRMSNTIPQRNGLSRQNTVRHQNLRAHKGRLPKTLSAPPSLEAVKAKEPPRKPFTEDGYRHDKPVKKSVRLPVLP